MLISHPPLDSTFNNPVDSLFLPYSSSTDDSSLGQQGRSPTSTPPQSQDHPPHERRTKDRLSSSSLEELLLKQLRDYCLHHQDNKNNQDSKNQQDIKHQDSKNQKTKHQDKQRTAKPDQVLPAEAMVDPEEDLRCLVENDRQLELCGYYYGSLSWLDASHLLHQCKVGTFLVRDSEHGSYLYTLSVQTRKGPTSCRIEYVGGAFRLDSSKGLAHKMPRFDSVTNLIDFYVRLPRYLPLKNCQKAVWLDMDEENIRDVPVQIYRPLYRQVRSLQHMCRVAVMREVDDRFGGDPLQVLPCKPYRTNPSRTLQTALEKDTEYKQLPNIIKDYLSQYPYSQ